MKIAALSILLILLGGCAGQRIIRQSDSFSQNISTLPIKEVLHNFDRMASNPYHIPSRTTFGNGSLQFTDNDQLTVTQPYHNIARNSGSLGATIGQFVDQYSLAIKPETDASNLLRLRNIYHWSMYGDWLGQEAPPRLRDTVCAPGHKPAWLFWTNLDGSASSHEPPGPAQSIGVAVEHEFFVSDMRCFSDFVLGTFGAGVYGAPAVSTARSGPMVGEGNRPRRSRAVRSDATETRPVAPVAPTTPPAPRNGAGISERQKGDTPLSLPTLLPLR